MNNHSFTFVMSDGLVSSRAIKSSANEDGSVCDRDEGDVPIPMSVFGDEVMVDVAKEGSTISLDNVSGSATLCDVVNYVLEPGDTIPKAVGMPMPDAVESCGVDVKFSMVHDMSAKYACASAVDKGNG